MSLFRRRGKQDGANGALSADAATIERVLGQAQELRRTSGKDFDLAVLVEELFERAPAGDVQALADRGVDAGEFYEDELRPNWDELDKGERAAKVKAFVRFANLLATTEPTDLAPIVRTKAVVLAWAYDYVYEESFLRQIQRKPDRFGVLELSTSE